MQVAALDPRVYHGRQGQTSLTPPRIEAPVTVDGNLDEPAWRSAALLTGFSVYSAGRQPARARLHRSPRLVFTRRDALRHPRLRAARPVNSSLAERDRIGSDDNVEIHLDTFGERNRALVFMVNPLGVQADGTKSEGGGFIPGSNVMPGQNDLSADFLWTSKGRVTDCGLRGRDPHSVQQHALPDRREPGLGAAGRAAGCSTAGTN